MRYPALFFVSILLTTFCCYGQSFNYDWGFNFASDSSDYWRIAKGPNNDIVVVGDFDGDFDFDPSSNAQFLNGKRSLAIAKYGENGNLIWLKDFDTCLTKDVVKKVHVDDNGNIYILGITKTRLDYDPSADEHFIPLDTTYTNQNFILKLNSFGELNWVNVIACNEKSTIEDFIVDETGNILGTGYFRDSIDLDPSNNVEMHYTNPQRTYAYFFKWDSTGAIIWNKVLWSEFYVKPNKIKLAPNNDIYLTGAYSKQTNFDPRGSVMYPAYDFFEQVFVARYNNNGDPKWVKGYTGSAIPGPKDLAFLSSGDAVLVGTFISAMCTDSVPTAGANFIYTDQQYDTNSFVMIINSVGKTIKAQKIASKNYLVEKVEIDSSDFLHFAGTFLDSCIVPNSNFSVSGLKTDLLVIKSDKNLVPVNVYHTGRGVENIELRDFIMYEQTTLISGLQDGTSDFGMGPNEHFYLNNLGQIDAFLVKYDVGGVGISELTTMDEIQLFPNPAKQSVFIKGLEGKEVLKINIYSSEGKCLRSLDSVEVKNHIDIQYLESGLYNFELIMLHGKVNLPIMKLE